MRRIALTLGLLLLASCFEDKLTGSSTVRGKYVLQTVNGSGLPWSSTTNNIKTEILAEVIWINTAQTYADTIQLRTTSNGSVTTSTVGEVGSYSLFGTSVTFTRSDAGRTRVAQVNGNVMTIIESGQTLVLSK